MPCLYSLHTLQKLVRTFSSVRRSTLKWPTLAQTLLKGKEVRVLAHLWKAIFTCCYRFSRELDNILGSVTSALINSRSIYLYGIFQPHFPIWAEEAGNMPCICPGNHKMDSAEWYWLKNSSPSGKQRRAGEPPSLKLKRKQCFQFRDGWSERRNRVSPGSFQVQL